MVSKIRRAKLFVFLRRIRHDLFDDAFQDELAAIFEDRPKGQPPIPPAKLALATILQAYTGVSDDEAIEALVMDRRWQLVLDCLDCEHAPFGKGTLVRFRQALIAHTLDRRLIERTVELAEREGDFGPRQLRAALDSSPLWGAGRVEDTYNLLGHALKKALSVIARQQGRELAAVAQDAGAEALGGSSLKAALDQDWDDAAARSQALGVVLSALEAVEHFLSQGPVGSDQRAVSESVAIARRVRDQDVEVLPENVIRLRQGVAKERRISVEDGQMRHGRKSRSQRVDGYKRHVLRDLDRKIVRAVGLTPANVPEAEVTDAIEEDLAAQQAELGELQIDRAYLSSRLVRERSDDLAIYCKAWPVRNGDRFPKTAFALDFAHGTIRCPNAVTIPLEVGKVVHFPEAHCTVCRIRFQCTTSSQGRSVSIHPDEPLLAELRQRQQTKAGRARLRERWQSSIPWLMWGTGKGIVRAISASARISSTSAASPSSRTSTSSPVSWLIVRPMPPDYWTDALVSGADDITTSISRDGGSLVTHFDPFTFDRSGPGGELAGISDGTLNMSLAYDSTDRVTQRSQTVNGTAAYREQLGYDDEGLINQKVETIGGTGHAFSYTYDANGQLTRVAEDGTTVEQYAYDSNGNRTSRTLGTNPPETGAYDGQDRLTQRGSTAYSFNAAGFLTGRGNDTFQYSTHGELLQAIVGGQIVSYTYDGLGRRIARTDSNGTTQYLYGSLGDPFRVTEARDPSGQLTRLYYGDDGLLYAMQRGSSRYYVATDHLGTPRVVTDSTGAAVRSLAYDSYGNVTSDSAPSFFLPIGFAGGLADAVTGLVHFEFRDYDPAAGRWTERDPSLYSGGQGNLYAYVSNNAVNSRDPSGLICIGGSLYEGIGGGATFCYTPDKGIAACAEAGFGTGGQLQLSPLSGLPDRFFGINAEASAGLKGVAGLNANVNYNAFDEHDGCTGFNASGGADLAVVRLKLLDAKDGVGIKPGLTPNDPTKRNDARGKFGVSAKVAVKVCEQALW